MQFATILNYAEYPSYYDQLVAQVSNSYLYVTGKFTNKFVNDLIPISITSFNYAAQSYSSITYYQTYLLYDLVEKNLYSATSINQLVPNIITIPIYMINNAIYTSYESLIDYLNNDIVQIVTSSLSQLSIDTSVTNLSVSLHNAYINTTNSVTSNIINTITNIVTNIIDITYSSSAIKLAYSGNVTSWSTTYSLFLNQALIISFTNSQTIFIPIQLTGNDIYKLYLTQNITSYNSGGTSAPIYLYPNNSSVSIIYTEFINNNSTADYAFSAFKITSALGSTDATIINNSPFTKTIIYRDTEFGVSGDPLAHLPAQIWADYTTSWTMLGTIVLSQASSGLIGIKRIR